MTDKKAKGAVKHGKLGTYTNHGCRCEKCLATHSEYQRNYMQKSPHQRRLAVMRGRVRYWKREVELREFRGQTHGPKSAAKARATLARYEQMYEDERVGNSDVIEPVT